MFAFVLIPSAIRHVIILYYLGERAKRERTEHAQGIQNNKHKLYST